MIDNMIDNIHCRLTICIIESIDSIIYLISIMIVRIICMIIDMTRYFELSIQTEFRYIQLCYNCVLMNQNQMIIRSRSMRTREPNEECVRLYL